MKSNNVSSLLSLSIPMALTQLIAVGSGFLCMAMVASLGHDVLAASALIFAARISIIIVFSSILFSLSILIGHAFGAKAYRQIGYYMQQGWVLCLVLSVPIILLFWYMHAILLLLGQPKVLTDIIKVFFQISVWSVVPFLIGICNQQLCYGTRRQKIDVFANIIGVIVLLFSAYIFIYGPLGLPKLGIAGFAYALNLQAYSYFLCTIIFIFATKFLNQCHLFDFHLKQSWQCFLRMLEVGWPISLQIGGEMLSFLFIAAMFGWLGTDALAAFQVVNQYQMLVLIPLFAIAQAIGVLIGQAIGAKKPEDIITLGNTSIYLTFTITFIVGVIFVLFPYTLAKLYLEVTNPTNAVTMHYIVILFAIVALSLIFDGLRNTLTGALRGLLDTRFPMFIGLIGIWLIGIPLGYLFGFTLNLGVGGIAGGAAAGIIFGFIFLIFRWFKLTKQLRLSRNTVN